MDRAIDRRFILKAMTLAAGGIASPLFARIGEVLGRTGFTHAVASGEPSATSMLLWTRYVPKDGGDVAIKAEISPDADFARVEGGGQEITGPWRDHTVKIDVSGLRPGTRYFYRFVAPDGTFSPVGRTRTFPEEADRLAFAAFSCANLPYGYFNAYGHAAADDDLAFALHLGDYIYEYEDGRYAPSDGPVGGDWPLPSTELFHLADYRLRYASYRLDPDLQALHMAMPMIASMDDHEAANNAWAGGAGDAATPDWAQRSAAALQAWREWLPVSDEPWKRYDIGQLASLYRTETRLSSRSRQPDLPVVADESERLKALQAFHDGAWRDPARTMLGSMQENWLRAMMGDSARDGRWQIVGSGTIVGESRIPDAAAGWLARDASAGSRDYVARAIMAAGAGLPSTMDSWGGYPAARSRLLSGAQAADADLVVLSGDSHNAWAFELAEDGQAAGVEFAGHSVTSPGMEAAYAASPETVARGLVDANGELVWCDTSRRGYMRLAMSRESLVGQWLFCAATGRKNHAMDVGKTLRVDRGRRKFAM